MNGVDPGGLQDLNQEMETVAVDQNLQEQDYVTKLNSARNALKNACETAGKIASDTIGNARHHIIPFFLRGLGGKKSFVGEELVPLLTDVHNRFHTLLDVILKMNGMVGKAGNRAVGGSIKYFKALRDVGPGGLLKALDSLLQAAKIFDEVCGPVAGDFKMAASVETMANLMGLVVGVGL